MKTELWSAEDCVFSIDYTHDKAVFSIKRLDASTPIASFSLQHEDLTGLNDLISNAFYHYDTLTVKQNETN